MARLGRAPDAVLAVEEEVAAAGEVLEGLRAGRVRRVGHGRRWRAPRASSGSKMRACGRRERRRADRDDAAGLVERERAAQTTARRRRTSPAGCGRAGRRAGRRRSSTVSLWMLLPGLAAMNGFAARSSPAGVRLGGGPGRVGQRRGGAGRDRSGGRDGRGRAGRADRERRGAAERCGEGHRTPEVAWLAVPVAWSVSRRRSRTCACTRHRAGACIGLRPARADALRVAPTPARGPRDRGTDQLPISAARRGPRSPGRRTRVRSVGPALAAVAGLVAAVLTVMAVGKQRDPGRAEAQRARSAGRSCSPTSASVRTPGGGARPAASARCSPRPACCSR